MANSKLTALTELSVPALEDITYVVDDPSGTPVERKLSLTRLGGVFPALPGGRLTTETGVAVSTSDRTSQGTLYYTPYLHNLIRIYDGTRWRVYSFAELSLSLSVSSGSNYDVFVYDNAGTLTLELSAAWTNNTTRSAALTTQDGVIVKSGATTRLWLGTIRGSGSNVIEDSATKRFMWNKYNPVPRAMLAIDATDSWGYTTNTIRQARASSANQVEYVVGDAAVLINSEVMASAYANTSTLGGPYVRVGVGVDSTTTFSGLVGMLGLTIAGYVVANVVGKYDGYPGLGYHYLSWNEVGDTVSSGFYGDNGSTCQSGIRATLLG